MGLCSQQSLVGSSPCGAQRVELARLVVRCSSIHGERLTCGGSLAVLHSNVPGPPPQASTQRL